MEAYSKHGNYKIGQESVPLVAFVSNKISPLSPGKFLLICRFFSATRRLSYCAGTNIWRDFSSSPLPFRSTPRWIFSSDPIPGEFPLLVTSFSASPVPVLFSQPAGYFSLLLSSFLLSVAVTYYLPFIPYHLLMRIDSLPLLSLFPGHRNLAFPSVLYLDLFTLSALKFVVMKLWWNMKFGIYSSPACDLFKFYIWLFTLSASNFPSSCSFAFTSGFPEFSTIAFERNSHRSVYFVSPFLSRRSC